MNIIDELWIAEYSQFQKCGHINKLKKSLLVNITNILCKNSSDFIPIFVGTEEQCRRTLNKLQKEIDQS